MKELGLIVIWPNFLKNKVEILDEISEKFTIFSQHEIEWSQDRLFENFYRFYGDRLSTKSIKEKTNDSNKFLLITFLDSKPRYSFRYTARGVEKVNSSFFDLKTNLRKKFNTKFGIHGSNDQSETSKDLAMLIGLNVSDYLKKYSKQVSDIHSLSRDVSGALGWESLKEFFYIINEVTPYIVLRKIELDIEKISDIDFLVKDKERFVFFANAKKSSKGSERANYSINIDGNQIPIDTRYVGDNYFDIHWERICLNSRLKNSEDYYVSDDENYYFVLLYHCLIHKVTFPEKHKGFFGKKNHKTLQKELYEFMHKKDYFMVEPKDITLNFNTQNGGNLKFSRLRRLRNKKGLMPKIKRLVHSIVHLERGPD